MIYIQAHKNRPMWEFGHTVEIVCINNGFEYKLIECVGRQNATLEDIFVGSVEETIKWFEILGIDIPDAIDLFLFQDFVGRRIWVRSTQDFLQDITYPIFIKPSNKIKAFTGTVVINKNDVDWVLEGYEGDLLVQEVINIMSEYRCYVMDGKIIGLKHYNGDHLTFPNVDFVQKTVNFASSNLKQKSFTLDFGVTNEGQTILIEANDAWAIGNYGLEPELYFKFIKKRWFQIISNKTNDK